MGGSGWGAHSMTDSNLQRTLNRKKTELEGTIAVLKEKIKYLYTIPEGCLSKLFLKTLTAIIISA